VQKFACICEHLRACAATLYVPCMFRREANKAHLNTFLVHASASLDSYPLLSRARAYWIDGIASRKPYCCACGASFAGETHPGVFLFATLPGSSDVASVSAICTTCHRDLSDRDIETICVRVLHRLWPNGKFLDAP
jgi:hypothetical protein